MAWQKLHAAWRERDAVALRTVLLAGLPEPEAAERVDALIRFALAPSAAAIEALATTPLERELLTSILAVTDWQGARRDHGAYPPAPQRLVTSTDSDGLLDQDFTHRWSALQWLNQLARVDCVPDRRVAAVTTMRDSGLSMLEWIAHHRALGVEGIYIYSNDNVDHSDELLGALADAGVITYLQNHFAEGRPPQHKAYAHALHLLTDLRRYEWVMFLDDDEFFMPGPRYGHRLDTMLDAVDVAYPEHPPSSLSVHWRWRTNGYQYAREPGLLPDRFPYATEHFLTKAVVRLRDVLGMYQLHFPELVPDAFCCDATLRPIDYERRWDHRPADYDSAAIDHYWLKSFEEFSIKKARGDAPALKEHGYDREFSLFFEWNKVPEPSDRVALPGEWVDVVKAQMDVLGALPGVAEARARIEAELPPMLARFDAVGGLARLYDDGLATRRG